MTKKEKGWKQNSGRKFLVKVNPQSEPELLESLTSFVTSFLSFFFFFFLGALEKEASDLNDIAFPVFCLLMTGSQCSALRSSLLTLIGIAFGFKPRFASA